MKNRICILLSMIMVFSMTMGILGPPVLAADQPAPIQDTYEIDGVTYFNTGSNNFAVDQMQFYRDLLGTRSNHMSVNGYFNEDWNAGEYGWVNFDQCEGDLWLQLGPLLILDLQPDGINNLDTRVMYNAARMGSDTYESGGNNIYSAARYDMVSQNSLKDAEDWVFKKVYGSSKDFGYFKNDTTGQPVLVTAVSDKEVVQGTEINSHIFAAYFTNFRVFALMPADEGTNYATEVIKDSVNSRTTVASTVKNLTAATVTGSQTVTNSSSAAVSSSVNGSEGYSYSKGYKVGAEYGFTDAFKVSGEYNYSATETFAHGWENSDSLSTDKSSSFNVSITMPPYTQAMMTQTESSAEYLTSYNCPIGINYDVTLVLYESRPNQNGVMHLKYAQPKVEKDAVYTFSDPLSGARGDLDNRVNSCGKWNDMDSQSIRWRYLMEHDWSSYGLTGVPDSINMLRSHVPMAPTGASYRQTLNIVANEVSGLLPTHPLCRIKIAEPGTGINTNEVNYQLFDYYTYNMEVGDFSYADYLDLVGLNKYDVPFYGFSKGSGYWIVTDKDGNEFDQKNSPVKLEQDPVSKNWRYTAVKPGICYLVYRIDEDAYCTAENPEYKIKNSDLKKTAALEIIVTENDPADTIVISGSYQGHANVAPESLEGENRLTVAVFDKNGKEIDRSCTWEAKELRGITVTEDGQVSFTKDGTYHVCAVSGKLRSDWYEITAGHKPADVVKENVIEPTCTKSGSCELATYCSVCGKELSREQAEEPATGHSFDDGTVTREPTREKQGLMTYTCTSCGRTVSYSIPLTHTVTFDTSESDDEIPPQKVKDGQLAQKPPEPAPIIDDFTFAGWFAEDYDGDLSNPFDFSTPITEDITLKAVFMYDVGGAENTRVEPLDGAPMIEEYISTEDEEMILSQEGINDKYGLVLISSPYAESDVPQADKDVLNSQAGSLGAAPGTWFDVSLYKMKDIWWGDPMEKLEDEGTAKLTSTAVPVRLMVDVPEELQKIDRTFYLLQYHDGKAEIAAQGKDNVLSWTSDAFSTFLIAYKDTPPCPMVQFTDTDQNEWYHNGVHWAIENGVMNGTGKSTFEPMTSTTRAMIVTMLWRMEGSPKTDGNTTFKDVQDSQWYTDAIRWAATNDIVNGYNEDTFAPNDSITREQMATILYRFAQSKGQGFNGKWSVPLQFDDADQLSEWAHEAMCWMNVNGIINGVSDTELSPQGEAVRAQVATMLMRFSNLIQDQVVYLEMADYQKWAKEEGYSSGLITAQGPDGINQDYFHSPVDSKNYSSGKIVIGDSRCCQMGIYEQRKRKSDFATFAVWGGHYAQDSNPPLMTKELQSQVEACFQEQIRSLGKSVIYLFATVNDYDFTENEKNDGYIKDTVRAAEYFASISYEYEGKNYRPDVVVIGFDGGPVTGTVLGLPSEEFNRFCDDYNQKLRSAVSDSDLLKGNLASFTTVPEIVGGKASFITDGLHYSDDTLDTIIQYIVNH